MTPRKLNDSPGLATDLPASMAPPPDDAADADATLYAVARLRAENERLRGLLLPTMAQRAWEGLVNGAVGTLLGVALAMGMSRPW